ncbi:MAG TPA: UDP-glucose 4-epimerase GalE [Pyrinomonadaceae bacterium]|nr:UDP-glucose 4-epimerase GalE [Pyrinomonadaceae bacterium]
MAILVTGGAGYIGSVAVDDLVDAGEAVVVLDNLSRGFRAAVNENTAFYAGDIGDRELVMRICREQKVAAVIHFSAFAYVGESVERPDIYYHNNVIQTAVLLDAIRECGVRQFVFSSTCATYGEPIAIPIDETHPQNPTNPYGRTKLMVEHMLADYDRAFGIKFVALRYFNACGATDRRFERHDPETHLIPLILDAAAGKCEYVSIFGGDYPTADGTAIRDYIHISDLSEAHILALKYLQSGGASDAFNLGNGNGFSVLEVIEAAKRVTGLDVPYKIEPRRAGDPSRLIAKADKAVSVLGWQPRHQDLESIIESAWKWRSKTVGKT